MSSRDRRPAMPLLGVFGDEAMARRLDRQSYVSAWIRVEVALVLAQAKVGLIRTADANAVVKDIGQASIDLDALDEATRQVGYPILPMLSQLRARSTATTGRYLHWGATTQDIMDTGLVLVLGGAIDRLFELLADLGDGLVRLARVHRQTAMVARTHAMPAVPTTFGAKVGVWLTEFTRHVERLESVEKRLTFVSLHGAAGTAAAFGQHAPAIRAEVARSLGLQAANVPWHTARDVIAELGFVVAAMSGTAGRIAREIIDLSRPEIGELAEKSGHLRGASSTMPQKANPISCETTIGMSHLATAQLDAILAAMRVEHERSAGEWQIEWDALPILICATAGALLHLAAATSSLVVRPDRMAANLDLDGGSVMAESVMMTLAKSVGRERAHAVVYEAGQRARATGLSLRDAVEATIGTDAFSKSPDLDQAFDPMSYLGEAPMHADSAVEAWEAVAAAGRLAAARPSIAPSFGSSAEATGRP